MALLEMHTLALIPRHTPLAACLPGDALLRVARFLHLEDALAFSMVCQKFHAISSERTFWMAALENTNTVEPLACPSYEDLSMHSLTRLRTIALHTVRRLRNWNLSRPIISNSIRAFNCDGPSKFVCQIPGTQSFVLHSSSRGTMECWDAQTTHLLSSVYVGGWISGASSLREQGGKVSVAVLVSNSVVHDIDTWPDSLIVLSLSGGQLQVIFHRDLDRDSDYRDAFLNTEIVGVFRLFEQADLEILAFNLDSQKSSMIKTDLTYDVQMGTASLGGDLYIVKDQRDVSYIHCCPNDLLPYGDEKPHIYRSFLSCGDNQPHIWKGTNTAFSTREDWNEVWYEPLGVLCTNPSRGVPIVTLHHIFVDDDADPRAINIRFWSANPDAPHNVAASGLSPAHSIHVAGSLKKPAVNGPSLCAFSGSHLLLIVELNSILAVRLVRYTLASSSSSIHLLELPPYIDLEAIREVSLDGYHGVIFLMDALGVVTIVPYA